MESHPILAVSEVHQTRPATPVNQANRSAFRPIRRPAAPLTTLWRFGLFVAASAFAVAQVTPPTTESPTPDPADPPLPTPEATAGPIDQDPVPAQAVPGRSILTPTTMTSRAVYTEETAVIADPSDVWSPPATDGEVFRTGQITVRPSLRYLYLYGDGMLSRPGIEENSSIHALSPAVAVGVGEVWTFSYAPIWTLYSNDAFNDTLNHRAVLRGQTSYQAWRFGASQGYSRNRSPLAETGGQTRVERFLTQLEAAYELNSRTRLRAQIEQNLRDAETASHLREWSASLWAYRQTGPAMTVGAGITGGYLDIEDQSNMSYGRLQGQLALDVSEKVSWTIHAGYERRSFLYNDAESMDKPLLGTSLIYRPVPTTMLSLDYDRSVGNSVFQNRVNESDTFGVRLNQRLLARFNLSASYTRREMDFVVNEFTPVPRDDRVDTLTVSLGTPLMRRLTGSVLYRYTKNDTNRPEFAYESDQYGVELRYGF